MGKLFKHPGKSHCGFALFWFSSVVYDFSPNPVAININTTHSFNKYLLSTDYMQISGWSSEAETVEPKACLCSVKAYSLVDGMKYGWE